MSRAARVEIVVTAAYDLAEAARTAAVELAYMAAREGRRMVGAPALIAEQVGFKGYTSHDDLRTLTFEVDTEEKA